MARRFAQDTDVPIDRTRLELEALLRAYKARAVAVFTSSDENAVAFEMQERRILFKVRLPDPAGPEFTHSKPGKFHPAKKLSDGAAYNRWDQACRRKWRALLIAIKAKLVAVDEGIETFEEAFLAHVVLPDGQTVGELTRPRIATAYKEQKMVPLMPSGPALPPPR
jgi:hypothetical protein